MIIIDLINDESPLFSRALNLLISEYKIEKDQVVGITEGNRWSEEKKLFNCVNRLKYFDHLDSQDVDIDKEIRRISIEYNNFNIFNCDRYLIKKSRAFQRKFLVYTYLFYEDIFKNGITHYFTTGIAFTYNLVSYQVAQRFSINHISFYGTRLKNKTAICYGVKNSFEEVVELYSQFNHSIVTEEMFKPLLEFVNKPQQPIYMKNAINSSTIKRIFIKEFFRRLSKYYFNNRHKYDLFTRNPFQLSLIKLKKIFNAKLIDKKHNGIFDSVNFEDDFYIFPLHMQPEASTLVLAPFYVNQKEAILNIIKVLPLNVMLYVKEHKSALGQHSLSFYKELKQYPNVKLISYRENTFDLIKRSKGTINLSSTVGLESLMLKRPSIVLGNVFFNDSGLTYKVNCYNDLEQLLNKLELSSYTPKHEYQDYEKRLAYYLYCLDQKSYPFEFNVAKLDTKERVLREKNIVEFANFITRIVIHDK